MTFMKLTTAVAPSPPQILLVISNLDDDGYLEDLLQPDVEHEGNEVPEMQCL